LAPYNYNFHVGEVVGLCLSCRAVNPAHFGTNIVFIGLVSAEIC